MTPPEVLHEARKQIGLHLRSIRKDQEIGLKTLSEKSGLYQHQILDIELSRKNYTIDSLIKYAHSLDIKILFNHSKQ